MSQAVSKAIYSTLAGSVALTSLLAVDPRGNTPAIYYARKNEVQPIYPCITFRECTVSPIRKLPTMTADQEMYDLEIWTSADTGANIDSVFQVMDPLLHRQKIVLPIIHDYLYQVLRIAGGSPANYDDKLKIWFGLFRYQFLHVTY